MPEGAGAGEGERRRESLESPRRCGSDRHRPASGPLEGRPPGEERRSAGSIERSAHGVKALRDRSCTGRAHRPPSAAIGAPRLQRRGASSARSVSPFGSRGRGASGLPVLLPVRGPRAPLSLPFRDAPPRGRFHRRRRRPGPDARARPRPQRDGVVGRCPSFSRSAAVTSMPVAARICSAQLTSFGARSPPAPWPSLASTVMRSTLSSPIVPLT
jgi:hypothetical protein